MPNQQPKIHQNWRKHLSYSLLVLLFAGPNTLASDYSAINRLENQIRAWLLDKDIDTAPLTIQVNDSRLQIPDCSEDFVLNTAGQSKDAAIRTIKASCPQPLWSRHIRVKAQQERLVREKETKEIERIPVLVIDHPIKQYESIIRDRLTEQKMAKHKVPANALTLDTSLKSLYARRALRAGQIVTTSDIIRPQKVIVVNSSLPAQTLIEARDLSTVYRIKALPHDAITSLQGIKNLATNRLLHAGDILRKRDLTKAKLIKRGELVMVEAKSANFQILNEAIAFQDGYFGDQIKLTSVGTKRPINARVIGKGKVRTLSKQWYIK